MQPPDAHLPEPAPVIAWKPDGWEEALYGRVVELEAENKQLREDATESRLDFAREFSTPNDESLTSKERDEN